MAEPSAEEVVAHLASKFSGLIDRVQLAESQFMSARQLAEALESQVQEHKKRRQSGGVAVHGTVKALRGEAELRRKQLQDAQLRQAAAQREFRRVLESTAVLEERCDVLNTRCRTEHQRALDATDAAARTDEEWIACERERHRLQSDAQVLESEMANLEEQLNAGRDRERQRRAEARTVEDRLQEANRGRVAAEQRAETQQDEACTAVKKVTLFRERVSVAQHNLARHEAELVEEEERLTQHRTDNQALEQEAAVLTQNLIHLETMRTSLEAALRENVEAHGALKVAEKKHQHERQTGERHEEDHRRVHGELGASSDALAIAEAELGRWRQRHLTLHDTIQGHRVKRERLGREAAGAGTAGQGLRSELQCLFAQTETLRRERDENANACEELRRKLNTTTPALETLRKRVRDLEDTLEDATDVAGRARNRKDSLVIEIGQGREKMRGLRRRHQMLATKAHALEERLVRSSAAFGGPSAMSSAPMPEKSRSAAGTPRGLRQLKAVQLRPAGSPPGPARASSHPSLPEVPMDNDIGHVSYLRQWVELEEARIGTARKHPMPTPVPTAGSQPTSPMSTEGRSPVHAPRSAVALAALAAGADPSEAVTLFFNGDCGIMVGGGVPVGGRP